MSSHDGLKAHQPAPGLTDLEPILTGVLTTIFQHSTRRRRIATGAALNTTVGAATVGGVTGLVGAFGTASTGTALASLSGAAANSATLAAIGGVVGGGMAAGGLLLAGGGIGAGVAAGIYGKRALLGSARRLEDLAGFETRIVVAITAFRKGAFATDGPLPVLTDKEKSEVRSLFLDDLLQQLKAHLKPDANQSFGQTLTRYHLNRLTREVRQLQILMDYWT